MKDDAIKAGFPALLAALVVATILSIFLYLMVRTVLFFAAPYHWYEKIVAFGLLAAETFILLHGFGYFLNLLHILRRSPNRPVHSGQLPALTDYPPVAIIVSSFKEPIGVVQDTLTCFYNLTYPNKHLFFLDDTRYDLPGQDTEQMAAYRKSVDDMCRRIGVNLFRRKWHGAKAGMINDFLDFIAGRHREGFDFQAFSDIPREEMEKYIIVFDADMNPFPDFVEQLVAIMEANPKLAFVQTPQYYSNFEHNRVARASGLQQAVFYEYICEGKSLQDAMFCCGTNVIFRREALEDIGGFDESSVTEDFATSLKFHGKGWSSAYLNRVCAFGMGPEDLGGYFKQQFRWALGTVGLFRTILTAFLRNPGQLKPAKWWEYFLSGTHYFVGWVFFMLALCPILYLFANVPAFFARPEIYFMFFIPYLLLSMAVFLGTLHQRGYRFTDLFQGIVLNAITFPVFMKASLLAMIGVRGTFGITPKGQSLALPLGGLVPQIALAAASFAAIVWGLHRLVFEGSPAAAIVVNCLWCLYHFIILSCVLYFNHPEES
ncbi:MAG: glycosyltransferase [Desulfobacteraceae bacterium]|nr:glycosyltransferase [Desulfobacteraceae bacterium]